MHAIYINNIHKTDENCNCMTIQDYTWLTIALCRFIFKYWVGTPPSTRHDQDCYTFTGASPTNPHFPLLLATSKAILNHGVQGVRNELHLLQWFRGIFRSLPRVGFSNPFFSGPKKDRCHVKVPTMCRISAFSIQVPIAISLLSTWRCFQPLLAQVMKDNCQEKVNHQKQP